MTRVLVVDDDPLVRGGLVLMLGGPDGVDVVGEAEDGQEAVDRVRAGGVDVVLMDLRMPRLDGIEATRAIKALPAPPAVIVLTTFDADEYVVRALAAGANGFLLKDAGPERILSGIRAVLAGEPVLSPAITESLIRQVAGASQVDRQAAARDRVASLTDRERAVAIAIGRGASNAEIAAELYLSPATVKAHLSRIFTKLEVTNRVQVAVLIQEAGLSS